MHDFAGANVKGPLQLTEIARIIRQAVTSTYIPVSSDGSPPIKKKAKQALLSMKSFLESSTSAPISYEELDLQEMFGQGSFASITKALWRDMPVVVKQSLPMLMELKEGQADLQRECNILQCMRHPNVVFLFGFGNLPEMTGKFLVLEYLEFSFKQVLDQDPSWLQRLQFTWELADAFRFLHERVLIIHRDIKSENVRFSHSYHPKVIDFGTAVSCDQHGLVSMDACVSDDLDGDVEYSGGRIGTHTSRKMTSAQRLRWLTLAGTTLWTAPEMLASKDCTQKSDVYSFGILMWELVSNRLPWEEELGDVTEQPEDPLSQREQLYNLILKGIRPILDPAWRADFVGVMQTCWMLRPSDRPSFREIVACFRAIIDAEAADTDSAGDMIPEFPDPMSMESENEGKQSVA